MAGLLCDLLWSDPDKDTQGWGENDRGVSFTFGADVVSKFLNRHDLDLICRAHQVSVAVVVLQKLCYRTCVTEVVLQKLYSESLPGCKFTKYCMLRRPCVCRW